MTVFIDTNVLLYAALRPVESETLKRDRARSILEQGDCALSLQVINEFFHQATHPRREHRLSHEEAMAYVAELRLLPVQDVTLTLFDDAVSLLRRGGFSFWDAMIVAAARAQGCDTLYTEDMQDGRILDELRIVNPFA